MLILLSYIGNYLYFQSKQLDAPFFLEHYYEMTLNEEDETTLTFYYLTNKSDTSTIDFVSIDGIEAYATSNNDFFMFDSNTPQYEQEYTHHYIKAVHVSFHNTLVEQGEGPWSFSNIEVHFSDGETILADIGSVVLHKKTKSPSVLETRISSSSNQHTSETSLISLQPITIEELSIPFPIDLSEDILVKIDLDQEKLGEFETIMDGSDPPMWFEEDKEKAWNDLPGTLVSDEMFPLSLEQNEWIRFLMQFNPTRTSYFQFSIKLVGKTESGEVFVTELPIIDHPHLSQKEINKIVEIGNGGGNK